MKPIAYINVEKRRLEFAEPIKWHTPTVANLDRIPLFTKEALAQEQEPVAWVVYSSAENDIVWADKGKRLKQNTPLYTTPPQRTWVGLTDEEVENLCLSLGAEPIEVRFIEAKLKEKNA
jgi:hypothetical protein